MRHLALLPAGVFVLMLCLSNGAAASDYSIRYVTPTARGNGSGLSREDSAAYTSSTFWSSVQSDLSDYGITVRWVDGQYNSSGLTLTNMGDPYHQLILTGDTPTGAILNAPVSTMLKFSGVQNTLVKNLTFTDPAAPDPDTTDNVPGYGFQISSNGSTPSRKIVMDNLTFENMTQVYYGATGATHDSYDISLRNSTFNNVGYDGHAHMMYNAYDPHHISVYNNTFIDSRGDYVRFRDYTEYGSVIGNTFVSTSSTYNRPFVAVPLFNDDDPASNPSNPNYEYFGTHFLVADNTFTYNTTGGSSRDAMYFGQYGYEPPGTNYLLSASEGAALVNGTTQQQKEFLLANMGIDGDKVRVYNNTYNNVALRGRFTSKPNYGATSQGWQGDVEVYDTWNHSVPNLTPGNVLVNWDFDGGDNGGSGWIDNSYQALEDVGWQILPGAADDASTFVDSDGSFGEAGGLMWVRNWQDNNSIDVNYQFERLTDGRIDWRMAAEGSGAAFRLYDGRTHEGGLSMLGVDVIDADTLRIVGNPTATQFADFPGVDFGQMHSWRWQWHSDPDGVNGTATLEFLDSDDTWVSVYDDRAFDYNVVPDTFWVQSGGDTGQNKYVVLDSFAVSVYSPLNGIVGDLNQDGLLDSTDVSLFVSGWLRDTSAMSILDKYYYGDLDLNGITNLQDAVVLHLALTASGSTSQEVSQLAGSVPEPAALALLGLGGLASMFYRGRRHTPMAGATAVRSLPNNGPGIVRGCHLERAMADCKNGHQSDNLPRPSMSPVAWHVC